MNFSFDESKFLFGVGALLGVISIFYFGLELIFDLSPTIKSFILVVFSALFFVLGDFVESDLLGISTYVFSGFTYLSFLIYVSVRFSLSQTQTLALLAGSSALFLGLGYVRNEELYSLDSQTSKKASAALFGVLLILVAVDVAGSQPEYRLDLKEDVTVSGQEISVGVLEVENSFPLSRNVDLPSYGGCVAYNETVKDGLFISPEGDGLIKGGATETYNLTDDVRIRELNEPPAGDTIRQREAIEGDYQIRTGECPDRPDNKTIYVSSEDGSSSVFGGRVQEMD
jgi:hypothetical protein